MDLTRLLAELPASAPPRPAPAGSGSRGVDALRAALGGVTLGGGLYRVFTAAEAAAWTAEAEAGLPKFKGVVDVFAADWLGRFYALAPAHADGEILLLEPAQLEGFEVPHTVESLHEYGIVDDQELYLERSFHDEWRAASGDDAPLAPDECVGFTVPPFLGGSDDVSNLDRTDMSVYWSLTCQLGAQVAGQPPGAVIRAVTIEDEPPKRPWWKRG